MTMVSRYRDGGEHYLPELTPKTDRIQFIVVTEPTTRAALLETGEVDAAGLEPKDAVRFINGGFHLPEAKQSVTWVDANTLLVATDMGAGSMTTSGYARTAVLWRRDTPLSEATTIFSAATDDVGVVFGELIALPFAWIVTMWIALSMPAVYVGRPGALIGVGAGWLAGAAVVAAAAVAGWRMLQNAYARWPERQVGTVLVGATFTSLLVLFMMERPEIWGLQLRVTETGAVLLAGAATLWIVGPIITLALHMLAGLPGRRPEVAPVPAWRGRLSPSGTRNSTGWAQSGQNFMG